MKRILFQLVLAVLIGCVALLPVQGVSAGSNAVLVSLPDLSEGQSVGGVVNLSALVAAPEPITSVEYFLDQNLLAKVVLAPYQFAWDTSQFAPGTHTLAVRATDRAGNTGEAQVRVNVVRPIEITVSAPRDVIPIGEKVKLNVDITALHDVAQLDLILDNQIVSSAHTPPFNLMLDTRNLQAGPHIITIRATDTQGQQAHASLALKFQAAADDYTWLRILIIVGLIAAVIAAGFAVWRTIKVVKHSYQRTCRVELSNIGNVPTRYEVLADDPVNALKFKLILNGLSLPQEPWVKPVARSASSASASPASAGSTAQPAKVREKGRLLVDIAASLSMIQPGEAGRSLARWSSTGRSIDYTAQRVEYTGQQVQDMGGIPASNAAVNKPAAVEGTTATSLALAESPATPALAITPGAWATPYLQPGDAIALSLIVDPGRPAQTQHFTFRVSSRALDPADQEIVTETANLQVAGVSLLKYYLPFFIIAGVTVAVIVVIALILANTGLVG